MVGWKRIIISTEAVAQSHLVGDHVTFDFEYPLIIKPAEDRDMIISREYIPLKILRQISDPAYHIFHGAYVSAMGEKRADEIMEALISRDRALCDREMGWCIPDVLTVLDKIEKLDYEKPLYTETLPYFPVPLRTQELYPKKKPGFVFFFHEDEEYGCFSQWYKASFTVEGIQYATCEQYMMARKALLFHDYEIFDRILKEKDPQKCKKLGKLVHGFIGHLWDECKEEIVYKANMAKFSQNYDIKQILIATGNDTLAEASPYDRIWGIGLSADDPKSKHPELWMGENLLGQALMRVRWKLALQNQMLEVSESGVHAGGDNGPDHYYVSPYQKREMDKLLKMVTGATSWQYGDILTHTNIDDEILMADGYQ